MLRSEELWSGPDDPMRVALANFMVDADSLKPSAMVPATAGESHLAALGDAPPEAVRKELLKYRVAVAIDRAYGRVYRLERQLKQWPHWEEQLSRFSMAKSAVDRP